MQLHTGVVYVDKSLKKMQIITLYLCISSLISSGDSSSCLYENLCGKIRLTLLRVFLFRLPYSTQLISAHSVLSER